MIINHIGKFVRNFGVVQTSTNLELSLGGYFAKGFRVIQIKTYKRLNIYLHSMLVDFVRHHELKKNMFMKHKTCIVI